MDLVEIKLNELLKKENNKFKKDAYIYLSNEFAEFETFLQNEIYSCLTDDKQLQLSDNITNILLNFKRYINNREV